MSYYSDPLHHPSAQNPPPLQPQHYQAVVSYIPHPHHSQSLSFDPSIPHNPYAYTPILDTGFQQQQQQQQQHQQPINYYPEQNGVSSGWVVKQAAPVTYPQAIQPLPLKTEASASTIYEAPPNSNLVGQNPLTKVHQQPKVTQSNMLRSQSIRCELCKIECDTVKTYEKHLSGKKHNKCLMKLHAQTLQSATLLVSQSSDTRCNAGEAVTPSGQAMPGLTSDPINLEAKRQKLLESGTAGQSIRVCSICNVLCNGEIAFANHRAGKKHRAQERCNTGVDTNPVQANVQQTTIKKRKNVEPAVVWCDACKLNCTSRDVYISHLGGKKHRKNLLMFQKSNSNITPASVAAPLSSIDPSKGVVVNTTAATSSVSGPQHTKKVVSEDVEEKKQNLMKCGVAADAVKTCTLCNVVCNSQQAFNTHLVGHKHAANVKRAEAARASSGLCAVYPPA